MQTYNKNSQDAVNSWIAYLQKEAKKRGKNVSGEHMEMQGSPVGYARTTECVVKVRRSIADRREWENEIWDEFNEELDADIELPVVTVILDLYGHSGFDPERDHFISIPEDILERIVDETSGKGGKIKVLRSGKYDTRVREYVDNWDILFDLPSD